MWDHSIPNIGLSMRRDTLEDLPVFPLPAGYSLRLYQPGDEAHWARIECSAEEFETEEAALARFATTFREDPSALSQRMLLLLAPDGLPIGTTTAWFRDGAGLLHWVAITQEYQGKGLSKPLVAAALHRMRECGQQDAYLHTQAPSWVAIRVYLQLGFRPTPRRDANERKGWAMVQEKLPDLDIPLPPEWMG